MINIFHIACGVSAAIWVFIGMFLGEGVTCIDLALAFLLWGIWCKV